MHNAGMHRPGKLLKVLALRAGEGHGESLSLSLQGTYVPAPFYGETWLRRTLLEHSSLTDVEPTYLSLAAKVL